jgi:hypothetical protein
MIVTIQSNLRIAAAETCGPAMAVPATDDLDARQFVVLSMRAQTTAYAPPVLDNQP